MTTLKTPEEVAGQLPQAILGGMEHRGFCDCGKYLNEDVLEPVVKAITQDRQATAQVLCDLLEGEIQDEYPMEDGVPVETYGYEQTHNQAIKQAQALIRQTLDPISSNER